MTGCVRPEKKRAMPAFFLHRCHEAAHGLHTLVTVKAFLPVTEVPHRRTAGAADRQGKRIAGIHHGRDTQQAQLNEGHIRRCRVNIGCHGHQLGRRI